MPPHQGEEWILCASWDIENNNAILDGDKGEVISRFDDITVLVHPLAMDARGDLHAASVHPEHTG